MAVPDIQSLAYSEILDLFAAGTPPEDILLPPAMVQRKSASRCLSVKQ